MNIPPSAWSPHRAIEVEQEFDRFIASRGEIKVGSAISSSPNFDNADYLLRSNTVVAEMKELQTELEKSEAYNKGLDELLHRAFSECPDWRPGLLGGHGNQPKWFNREYIRIFRPQIARIVKKANKQIRETKAHFGVEDKSGILLFVNDHFTHIPPQHTFALTCNILQQSYSSIDCLVYLTVNRYVSVPGSHLANLIWMPSYSDRAEPWLSDFVNEFGAGWFDHLQGAIGRFDDSIQSDDPKYLNNANYIQHDIQRA